MENTFLRLPSLISRECHLVPRRAAAYLDACSGIFWQQISILAGIWASRGRYISDDKLIELGPRERICRKQIQTSDFNRNIAFSAYSNQSFQQSSSQTSSTAFAIMSSSTSAQKKVAIAAAAAGCVAAGYFGFKALRKYCKSARRAPGPAVPPAPAVADDAVPEMPEIPLFDVELGKPSLPSQPSYLWLIPWCAAYAAQPA